MVLAAWSEPHSIKNARWNALVLWAQTYGFSHLIPNLRQREMYFVSERYRDAKK
jgi:hypothetical protein